MRKPRDLDKVIDQLLEKIPEDVEQIRFILKGIRSSYLYAPPEAAYFYFGMTESALTRQIGKPPSRPWHWEVLSIWMARPVEELQEIFYEYRK